MTGSPTKPQIDWAYTDLEVLHSKEDASVNFIRTCPLFPGKVEARYVRRRPDYFIAYLSSQTGCKQACAFCHLTRTKQTKLIDIPAEGILQQAHAVLNYYAEQCEAGVETADTIHFSYMARGSPLASNIILNEGDDLFMRQMTLAKGVGLYPRIMVSSIFPKSLLDENGGILGGRRNTGLADIFPLSQPNIYYSIYSLNEDFRKKWLPNAMPVGKALELLAQYQEKTNKIIRLHWALIKGENDSEQDCIDIMDEVDAFGLRVDVNLVRYNPYQDESGSYGEEADFEKYRLFERLMIDRWPQAKIKTVDRVGQDVKASCGMFVNKGEA